MNVVMPPLLQFAQLKPDETITSANDIDESDERFEFLQVLYLQEMCNMLPCACKMCFQVFCILQRDLGFWILMYLFIYLFI